ncbi:MAG: phosphatidate cytidylyltransferase [Bacteroidales bacterium]|nr:phosphatidate cytidylyltransferase [Bacteroidales bacterium]
MNNFVTRTISGVIFLSLMIGGLLWCKYSYALLMIVITVWMMTEFFRMTMNNSYRISRFLSCVTAVTLFGLIFMMKAFTAMQFHYNLIVLAFIPVFIVMICSLYTKDKSEFGKFSNIYTAILYIAVPMTMTLFAVFHGGRDEYDPKLLISLFCLIWGSDVGAYLFGLGLHKWIPWKLFESVSPKKTWIGALGGMVFSVGLALGLHHYGMLNIFDSPQIAYKHMHIVFFGVVINVAAVYGDLLESQWKRYYNIKDSGNAIPGHGGLLDRFDSSLMAIPAAIVYLMGLNLL